MAETPEGYPTSSKADVGRIQVRRINHHCQHRPGTRRLPEGERPVHLQDVHGLASTSSGLGTPTKLAPVVRVDVAQVTEETFGSPDCAATLTAIWSSAAASAELAR